MSAPPPPSSSRPEPRRPALAERLQAIIATQNELMVAERDLAEVMALVAQRTGELTQAIGTVVEMVEGEELVYRAATGMLSHALGTRLPRDASLSGLCVASGEVLACEDSETDPRVHRETCRRLGVRSMLVVPLRHAQRAVGVLKVMSAEPAAFTADDVHTLQLMAGLLGAAVARAAEHEARAALLRAREEAARGQEERAAIVRAFLDGSPLITGMVQLEGERVRHLAVSGAAAALLGRAPGDVEGRFADETGSPPETIATYVRAFRAADASAGPVTVELQRRVGDELRDYTLTVSALPERPDVRHRRYIYTTEDVTQRKRTAAQLEQARDAALEASRLKSEFVANISHELRTPLNGILGMASLLMDTRLDAEQHEFVTTLRRSGEALLSLVDDVLDLSRVEAGKLSLELVPCQPAAVAHEVAQLLGHQARHKGLSLEVEAPAAGHFHADPSRLRQVLLNLVGNALKFTERGGVRVVVRLGETAHRRVSVRFEVRDTGPGVPERQRARIFEPFTQGDRSNTRRYGGSGLGLTISKRLVELMGGTLDVQSTPGEGATFWFELPLAPAAAPEPARDTRPEPTAALPPGLRVLVAEDNPVNQRVAVRMLEKLGCRVDVAGHGREALRLATGARYALVLMDCEMPEVDGYAATRALREHERAQGLARTPVVALTAHALSGTRETCLAAGMDDYLTKPVRPEELARALRRWAAAAAS